LPGILVPAGESAFHKEHALAEFIVEGPFEVPVQKNKGGRVITTSEAKLFWSENPEFNKKRGCYVFGIRAGKGIKPAYVGKATRSFEQEVFTPHKRAKYMEALSLSGKGTPVLFFVCLPKTKGAPNRSQINEVESFLIQTGMKANRGLLNEKKTRVEAWSIRGVLRSGQGKPTAEAHKFKRLMGV
jgi:hypothetical protein